MSLIADSGAIYAIYDADDAHHKAVCEVIDQENTTIIIPDVILVEIDYLLREFLSIDAELDFMNDLIGGSYKLEPLKMNDYKRCQALIEKYRNLDLGLADSAVIAVAERLKIYRILTVDERDFRVVRPKGKKSFLILPADNYMER
jgi:predicted nucleic acid-binding protein